jgi:hypothetical protein
MINDELRDFIEHHSSNKLHDECIERILKLAEAVEEMNLLLNALPLDYYPGLKEWQRKFGN